jgi:hypothetical protein
MRRRTCRAEFLAEMRYPIAAGSLPANTIASGVRRRSDVIARSDGLADGCEHAFAIATHDSPRASNAIALETIAAPAPENRAPSSSPTRDREAVESSRSLPEAR